MKNFWGIGSWLLVVLVMLFLGGCAKPDSAVTKAYEIDMKTETGSNVVILVLDADVESSTAVKQDAKADARTQVDATLSPVGKVGEAAAVAEGLLEAVEVKEILIPEKEIAPAMEENEVGKYHGLTNGDRATWYFSKNMREYPSTFEVVIPGCKTLAVENNGVRFDLGGGYLVKQSDVSSRGMAVLAGKGCGSTIARVQ